MINMKMTRTPKTNLVNSPGSAVFKRLGDDIIRFMIDRTKNGIDVRHSQFEPYSATYEKYREEMGKTTSIVNLQDRGEMHRSLSVKPSNDQAFIYYRDRNRGLIALRHQRGQGVPKREHFGLSDADASRFLKNLSNIMMRLTRAKAR